LARVKSTRRAARVFDSEAEREFSVFRRFVNAAGTLLPANEDGWTTAFAMQHHGLPTRLLDWSSTLGVALYFAIHGSTTDAAIWILNPFELNRLLHGRSEVFDLPDFDCGYVDYYITRKAKPLPGAIALEPPRNHPRILNQRGGFTLHTDLMVPL